MKHRPQPPKQLSFASCEFTQKKRETRREKFLCEMEQVVPWARLEALIEPKEIRQVVPVIGRAIEGIELGVGVGVDRQSFVLDVVRRARMQGHPILAEPDRLRVAVCRDVFDFEDDGHRGWGWDPCRVRCAVGEGGPSGPADHTARPPA